MDYSTGSGPGQGGPQPRGFFGSLFDFSFNSFVTSKIIGVLYVISVVLLALFSILWIVAAFNQSAVFGAVTLLILAPLFFLLSVIYIRVLLELAIVLFRILENTTEIARQGRGH